MLTQPQSVSAKGNYYSVSWSVKLFGTVFLVLVLRGDTGGALTQFWASGELSSFLGIFKLHSLVCVSSVELNLSCPWEVVLVYSTLKFCCFGRYTLH